MSSKRKERRRKKKNEFWGGYEHGVPQYLHSEYIIYQDILYKKEIGGRLGLTPGEFHHVSFK
ncbi:hypothetical protein LEMLEM_LOCUS7308 [Lemmus lemmus]